FAVLRSGRGRAEVWVGAATDIHEQKRAEDAEHFLVRVGTELAASRERGRAAGCVARAALGGLADWCVVYETGEAPEGLRVAAVAHADPAAEAATRAAAERSLAGRQGPGASPDASARPGAARLVAEVGGREGADGPWRSALLRELGTTSWMHVPLEANGRVLGAVEFGLVGRDRRYDGLDARVAEQLGRSAALATENERLFEAAGREKRRAEEAGRAKDEFLAMLSHELRTPLNAILGWSRMLASGELDQSRAQRALETIERNAKAQAHLIDDLLDVARIIGGKLRLDVRPLYPFEAVEGAIEAVRPAAEAREVTLSASLDPKAGPVMGDPGRLQQIAWNLLSNAVKFTPKGGRVGVALRREGALLELAVEDSGKGIDPALLEHLFVPFWQADPSITRAHGGLGLGLSIVKHLV
ncbi:MAG TPA: HAMP domain-containing sensor histidine kinase, partial [Polyangiaceae bacterium]|nr:HAMP domain-containing sensor histidine kinase [Polyangiaceae bacterium]